MVTILIGNNSFMLGQALRDKVADFVREYDAMAVERFDGEQLEVKQLNEIVHALPFLTAKRMVVIKNLSRNKPVAEKFQPLVSEINDTTELILVEESPDKRSGFVKFLLKQPGAEKYDELSEHDLNNWLQKETEKRGGKLGRDEAKYLIERLGPDQLQLSNELDKLIAYEPTITKQTIELLTDRSPQSSVFELLDYAFAGNTEKMLELYSEQRAQKVEPLAILGMIAWQLHILALVKAGGERDLAAIASEAKISPYVVRKTASIAKNTSLRQIKAWVQSALDLDIALKSRPISADDALQYLLISFSNS